MTVLTTTLPIVIDILIIVLLTIGIILGIKCIYIIDRTRNVIDNLEGRFNSLNAFFKIIDLVNNKFSLLSDKVLDIIEKFISNLLNHEKKEVEVKEKKGKKKDE